jgi:hypothetical protein
VLRRLHTLDTWHAGLRVGVSSTSLMSIVTPHSCDALRRQIPCGDGIEIVAMHSPADHRNCTVDRLYDAAHLSRKFAELRGTIDISCHASTRACGVPTQEPRAFATQVSKHEWQNRRFLVIVELSIEVSHRHCETSLVVTTICRLRLHRRDDRAPGRRATKPT